MYLALWIAHSSFCSTRMAPTQAGDGVLVGEDADDVGSALDLAMEPFQLVGRVQLGPVLAGEAHVTVDSSPDGKRIRKDLLSYFIFRGAIARIPNVSSTAWRSKSRIERFS